MPEIPAGAHRHTSSTFGRAEWFIAWARCALAILCRPALWVETLRLITRFSPVGWWRRFPFVPRPDRAYLRFRLETAYGADTPPRAADLVAYLEWCRERDAMRRRAA